ncbi:NHL repeat-containing protein [Solirubrobacter ginsenosidimutans]|uniref:NHL repeat-containing protein n=1 Tax=Solirubrobacter ginsenosidimutans TaxID=490573 RepID=UPI0022CE19D7|nr:NHL repeat-containing protein [Solirubrobacter ginsenosidimutans]
MTGRGVAIVIAAALAAPSTAAAYPDWRDPTSVGAPQEGVLRFPQALAYDASGTPDPDPNAPAGPYVYVADQHTFFVQKFTVGGAFVRRFGGYGSEPGRFGTTSSSASPTTGTVGGIGGVAVDARGRVYVLDSFNSRVERFSPGGEFQSQFGTFGAAPGQINAGINGGLALLGDDLYLGDQDNDRVQRFHLGPDGRPDAPPVVFGSQGRGPGQFDIVAGLAVDPARDHAVFVADDRNNRIQRFSAGGAFEALTGTLGSGPGQFSNPYDAGVDLAGHLFVADNQNHRVVRLDAGSLAFATSFGGAGLGPGKLNNVRGIAVAPGADASGGVFATNTSLNQISEFGVDGAYVRSWGGDGRGPGAFMQPRDVAVEANGDIVVADTRADRVQVLRASGAMETWARISTALGTPTSGGGKREFRDPTAVAVDPRNGDVWVAEGGGHRVQKIPQSGDVAGVVTYGGPNASSALGGFMEPLGIAVAADGTVWVADTRNDRLQRRDPVTGAWTAFGGFVHPTAVAALGDGSIAAVELGAEPDDATGKGRLTLLAPDGTRRASFDGLDRPEGVASDGRGGVLVSETQRDRVVTFSLLDGQLVRTGELAAHFTRPMGLDVDPGGRLLVTDTYANRLVRFQAPAVSEPGGTGGSVAPALTLTLGAGGQFPAFTPGVARTYTTTLAADVLSTAGDAALTVTDPSPVAPDRLVNGAYALAQPLLAAGAPLPATVKTWAAPVAHDPVAIGLSQSIGATEPLRTGTYAKTLTFTLATTQP